MTAIAITGMGLTGVLRITWVQDDLAHVLDHSYDRRDLRDLDRPGLPRLRPAAGRRRGQRGAAATGR